MACPFRRTTGIYVCLIDFIRKLFRGLTLNDLLSYLEDDSTELENVDELSIAMLPPVNANDDLTDEDSGDENDLSINNLPQSQLLAEADIVGGLDVMGIESEDQSEIQEEWDDEDDVPLAQLVKRPKLSLTNKSKVYQWSKNELTPDGDDWPEMSTVPHNNSPIELFYLFFDEHVLELFVTKTNLYAARRNRRADITPQEMKCFFGILLLSGYCSVSRRRMYWEKTEDCHNKLVAETLSRDRFEHIMTNLHCCDNNSLDKDDRFAKVRPLIKEMNERFLQYAPHVEHHSIDEGMVPYFGRHPGKQFIKGKPVRYGYKLWVGATSYGYVIFFDPYQGANSKMKKYSSLGLGPSIILTYSDVILSKIDASYRFYFDNFFTTVPLLEELSVRKIKGTGTIRENRRAKCPLPTNKSFKIQQRGTYDYRTTNNNSIIVTIWNDNNIVSIASNCSNVFPVHQVSRFSRANKKRIVVDQPQNIHVYNKFMGGVDRSDQNISLYRTNIRGKKWYFPLIAHMLDLAVQNAWLLHKKTQNGKMGHLEFRRRIVLAILAQNKRVVYRTGRPSNLENADSRYDRMDHSIASQQKQTRCRHCHKKVSTICVKCKVALHVQCFIPYHTPAK